MVAFRRKKTTRNHVVGSDILSSQVTLNNPTLPCGKCKKTCHLINKTSKLINCTNGRSVIINSGGNCKSKKVIYAARCKVHDLIYVGHTGEELSQRFSKHRYDASKRPDNTELSKHIAKYHHDFERDIDITVLKSNLETVPERELFEDLGSYGKEMYDSYVNLFT